MRFYILHITLENLKKNNTSIKHKTVHFFLLNFMTCFFAVCVLKTGLFTKCQNYSTKMSYCVIAGFPDLLHNTPNNLFKFSAP